MTERQRNSTTTSEEDNTRLPDPPDGGWGWIVVFGSFMIHVIADGVTYTFGVFYIELAQYYNAGKGATSWIPSILVGLTLGAGPLASALTNKYGCRIVAISGAVLASAGLIASIFATSIAMLYFFIGVCAGIGFALMYLPAIACVSFYFKKYRAFATGIAVCGSGVGTFTLAPLIDLLIEKYAWKGAMLIVAGLVLNCAVFGALFRPVELTKKKKPRPASSGLVSEKELTKIHSSLKLKYDMEVSPIQDVNIMTSFSLNEVPDSLRMYSPSEINQKKPEQSTSHTGCYSLLSYYGDKNLPSGSSYQKDNLKSGSELNLMQCRADGKGDDSECVKRKDIAYYIYKRQLSWPFFPGVSGIYPVDSSNPQTYRVTISTKSQRSVKDTVLACYKRSQEACGKCIQKLSLDLYMDPIYILFTISNFCTSIGFNVPYIYIKDRAELNGIPDTDSTTLISIIGVANTVSRVVLGYISDKPRLNRLWLYNSALTICGISTMLSSFCLEFYSTAVYAAIFGITAGAYVGLTSVILVDLMGLEKFTNAFGLLLLFQGIASTVGPPIAGFLYDELESYDPGFYVAGAMIAASGLMLFPIPCLQRYIVKRKARQTR